MVAWESIESGGVPRLYFHDYIVTVMGWGKQRGIATKILSKFPPIWGESGFWYVDDSTIKYLSIKDFSMKTVSIEDTGILSPEILIREQNIKYWTAMDESLMYNYSMVEGNRGLFIRTNSHSGGKFMDVFWGDDQNITLYKFPIPSEAFGDNECFADPIYLYDLNMGELTFTVSDMYGHFLNCSLEEGKPKVVKEYFNPEEKPTTQWANRTLRYWPEYLKFRYKD